MLLQSLFSAIAIAAAAAISSVEIPPGSDIPLVNVNRSSVSVSGISAGAFMAVQMHITFSISIKSVGVLAGTVVCLDKFIKILTNIVRCALLFLK